MNSSYRYIAICVLSTLGLNALAADVPKAKAEELFPDTTFAALIIPDLSAARAAAGKTRLADMYAQPDMQAFLAPPIAQLKSVYNDLRTKNALLPALEDLDAGFFSGEFAEAAYVRPGDRKTPVGAVFTLAPRDPEAFRRLLPRNVSDLLTEGQVVPMEELGIACVGGRVVACFPQADIGQILSRLKDPASRSKNSLSANASFTALNTHLAGSAAFLYLSPPKLIDALMTDPEFRISAARGSASVSAPPIQSAKPSWVSTRRPKTICSRCLIRPLPSRRRDSRSPRRNRRTWRAYSLISAPSFHLSERWPTAPVRSSATG
jgi:hypothetical protein